MSIAPVAPEPIRGALRDLCPLSVSVVAPGSDDLRLFNSLLAREHYLGHRNSVGENLRYLARDRYGRPVACALFGSAAWKCAARDAFLGWDRATRERNLQRLTNNTRFLIPGWVQVPHLASHVLGLIARRIRSDWQAKVWASRACTGNLRGPLAVPGRLPPRRQLGEGGPEHRSRAQ